MKQIISFAFAILFIACQNQPLSPDTISLVQSTPSSQQIANAAPELCETSSEENLNLAKELENKELPGFYHRAPVLRSEFDLKDAGEASLCQSLLTTAEDDPVAKIQRPKTALAGEPSAELILKAEKWKILTEQWNPQPAILSSFDPSIDTSNPACETPTEWDIEDMMLLARN